MPKKTSVKSVVAAAMIFPAQVASAECWVAGSFSGYSAESGNSYQFQKDSFADGMLICFSEDSGHVTGNDLPLVRMGPSTLIGLASNPQGLQTVNVYQIDREHQKLLFTQSRIGTATVTDLLPDYAAVFVADVSSAD